MSPFFPIVANKLNLLNQADDAPSILDLLLLKAIRGSMPEFDPIRRNILPSRSVPGQAKGEPDPGGRALSLDSAATARRRSTDRFAWADHPAFSARPGVPGTGQSPGSARKNLLRGDVSTRKRRRASISAGSGADYDGGTGPATGPVHVATLGRPHRVIVVGAGFAGIAAALELQRLGVEVIVLEVSFGHSAVGVSPCGSSFHREGWRVPAIC